MTLTTQKEMPRSFVQGAATASAFSQSVTSGTMLAADLAQLVKAIEKDDLSHAEGMLMVQAQALDAIFNRLSQMVAQRLNGTGYNNITGTEIYLRLALKAQSQCRATLQALASIKNPPVYAQQANISNGPQQVNNGTEKY